jgi:hypothetical protein
MTSPYRYANKGPRRWQVITGSFPVYRKRDNQFLGYVGGEPQRWQAYTPQGLDVGEAKPTRDEAAKELDK